MGKNYFYSLTISLVNVLFPIITFRYAAHILGPEGIGKVQFAVAFAEYFALFAALGIPLYGIAATARFNQSKTGLSKIFTELISLHAISGLVFSALYFLCIFNIPFFAANISLYTIAGLIIFLGFTSVDWFYFGIEKFKLVAVRSVLIKIIAMVLLFIFVKTSSDFLGYLWILLFTMLGNNLISLLLVGRHAPVSFRGIEVRKHIKPVLFILGSNLAINMYALWDTLILGFLTNERMVGLYYAAIRLVKFAIPVIVSLGASLIPRITQTMQTNNEAERTRLLNKTFHFLVFIGLPIAMGVFLLAPEFIFVLSGAAFYEAVETMRVLAVLPLLIGFGHFFLNQIMLPAGLNRQIFYATLISAIFSVGLNFLLIPMLNIMGAGITNVFSELLVTCLFYYFVAKNFKLNMEWQLLPKALICSLVFIPVIYLIRLLNMDAWFVLISSVGVCGIVYISLQFFIFKDALVKDVFTSGMKYLFKYERD